MKKLKNKYFILRHGHSHANKKDIIISDPSNGINSYGLTETGKSQIKKAIKSVNELNQESIIFSSPFLRTMESAQIVQDFLNCKKIHITDKLRERFFGNYEKTSIKNNQKVWDKDQTDIYNKDNNVESAHEVWERLLSLINEIEKKYSNKNIILISHGDPLQILLAGFNNKPVNKHREIKHLNTAEIRKLY